MDYYSILQVKPDANLSDIKKSYKKLAVKYHPDKNNNTDSHNKFVDINTAYQVLSDETRRSEYDRLNIYQRGQLYDLLKESLEHLNIFSENKELFSSIIEYYYGDENDFKKDINNFNFKNIYNKFYTKLTQSQFDFELNSNDHCFDHDIPIYNRNKVSINDINDYSTTDIYGVIYTNLKDRYLNKYKKITVTRQSDNTNETFSLFPWCFRILLFPKKVIEHYQMKNMEM